MVFARISRLVLRTIAIPTGIAAISALNFTSTDRSQFSVYTPRLSPQFAFAQSDEEEKAVYKDHASNIRLFGGSNHPTLTKQIAQYLGLPQGRILLSKFADGETHIQVYENVRDKTIYLVTPTISNDRASAGHIVAVIPYFGYARQDRKNDAREPIAAADIARVFEQVGVDRITAVDLHSGQIEGFFYCPVDNIPPWSVAAGYFAQSVPCVLEASEKLVVVAAHENQVHRTNAFREHIQQHRKDRLAGTEEEAECPVGFALVAKSRGKDGRNVPYLVGDVRGATCIVVDDIVNTGSTITNAVRVLKENGAKNVYAFATHAKFREGTVDMLEQCEGLDFLLVTNSIPMYLAQPSNKIRRVSIAPLLGEAIHRIQDGRSIHALLYEHHVPCPPAPCDDDSVM